MANRREIRVFEIEHTKAEQVKSRLDLDFLIFLKECSKDKAMHHIKYDKMANARFHKEYGYSIIDYCKIKFYNPNKTKHTRRKLGVPKSDDT